MPLYASAFFIPTSPGIPYILEDIYLRGSWRSVATIADRNAIKSAARKQGCVCYVREDQTIYWIPGSAVAGDDAWQPFDVTQYVNFALDNPLQMSIDEETGQRKLSLNPANVMPAVPADSLGKVLVAVEENQPPIWATFDGLPATDGQQANRVLALDEELKPIWTALNALPSAEGKPAGSALLLDAEGAPYWGNAAGLPPTTNAQSGDALLFNGEAFTWGRPPRRRSTHTIDFDIPLADTIYRAPLDIPSASCMVIRFVVSHPNVRVELHASPQYDDANPYTFVSTAAKMEDDGTRIVEGGVVEYYRRYGFISAIDPGVRKVYVQVSSTDGNVSPRITLDLLPLE